MLGSTIDFLRVLIVFAVLYLWIPYALATGDDRLRRLASGFIRAVLFIEVTALVLGAARLCLPGSMLAAYALYVAALVVLSRRRSDVMGRQRWASLLHRLFQAIEHWRWIAPRTWSRPRWLTWQRLPIGLLLVVILLAGLAYPIANQRFQEIGSYSRAMSLAALTYGQPWPMDGSIAFLAPLAFATGLPAITVVRHANVILAALLTLAAAFVVYRLTKRRRPALAAMGVVALVVYAGNGSPELTAAVSALLFWFLAVATARRPFWDLYFGISLALLISPVPNRESLLIAGVVALVALASPVADWLLRLLPSGATAVLFALAILAQAIVLRAPDGPYQYEAAARSVERIAATYPRNDWLVVSPAHETPFLYGRGWHVELVEFTRQFTLEQVSNPAFEFGYAPRDVFVFVEKIPLGGGPGAGTGNPLLGTQLDPGVIAYNTPQARQSLEFQAGRLMAAYNSSHQGTSVYYEDDNLVVYHVTGPGGPEPDPAGVS